MFSSKIIRGFTDLDAMSVSSVGPTRRRKSDERVREVDKNIHQVPIPDGETVVVSTSLYPLVVDVASFHVMTNQEPRSFRQTADVRPERDGGAVKGEMKGIEVRARLQVLKGFDWE